MTLELDYRLAAALFELMVAGRLAALALALYAVCAAAGSAQRCRAACLLLPAPLLLPRLLQPA